MNEISFDLTAIVHIVNENHGQLLFHSNEFESHTFLFGVYILMFSFESYDDGDDSLYIFALQSTIYTVKLHAYKGLCRATLILSSYI